MKHTEKRFRIFLIAGIFCMFLFLLTGCASQPAPDTSAVPTETVSAAVSGSALSLSDAARDILPQLKDLKEMPAEDLSDLLGIEKEEFTDVLWLAGDGLDGREVLAIRGADAVSADHIEKMLNSYLEQRRKETRNYLPEAYQLLSAAEVSRKNLTVVLISGPEAASETSALLAGE